MCHRENEHPHEVELLFHPFTSSFVLRLVKHAAPTTSSSKVENFL